MNCPNCNAAPTKVLDSRPVENGSAVRRRRFCPGCAQTFQTFERVETQVSIALDGEGAALLSQVSPRPGRRHRLHPAVAKVPGKDSTSESVQRPTQGSQSRRS